MDKEKALVISSSFTAEPLRESIFFWLDRLNLAAQVVFGPQLQLIQNLLDADSPLNTNPAGLNVVLLRWQDLDADGGAGDRPFFDLAESLRASVRAEVPLLIVTCPPSPGSTAANRMNVYSDWDRRLARAMGRYANTSVMIAADWQALYPVANPYEPGGDELALLPYSPAAFAVIGTLITRKFHMLTTPPYKAIAVDCDDTLWDGVCGEDGPRGVRLNPPHRALQEFLVSQLQRGCLLCLCSKNNPEDVEAVFRERPDMPLRWEHFAAFRVNWNPKPENLLAMSDELGLGTDSFIFMDDNPLECETMRQSLPNVLTLQLPPDRNQLEHFLQRVWAFDRLVATNEDKQRTALYQRERERERLRRSSATLEDFIAGLKLRIEFKPLSDENLCRASQLTFRVNQFSLTTLRRTEAELSKFRRDDSLDGWVVDVSDRFGAYGVVGLILFEKSPESLQVDSFLLSCRALGRGVEHRMVVELGTLAKSLGLARVDLCFIASGKNQPAQEFLESELGDYRRLADGAVEYRVPVDKALALHYLPTRKKNSPRLYVPDHIATSENGSSNAKRAETLAWIASELLDGDAIHAAIQDSKRRENPNREMELIQPRTSSERLLAEIWSDVLGVTQVGIRDNFFQIGGDSLGMLRIILRLFEATDFELPIRAFFEAPTIEEQLLRFPLLKKNDE
jgi:FkbH-like protein